MSLRGHCALCAPTVFLVRIKAIRTKNTVIDKNKDGAGVLSKIADRVRSDRPKRERLQAAQDLDVRHHAARERRQVVAAF